MTKQCTMQYIVLNIYMIMIRKVTLGHSSGDLRKFRGEDDTLIPRHQDNSARLTGGMTP